LRQPEGVSEFEIIQGRRVGAAELAQVLALLAAHPDWSRWRLSRHLAEFWDWRSATGQLKDMAARTLLLKLEQRGCLALPPRRCVSPNRMRHKQVPALDPSVSLTPIRGPLADLLPLSWSEVSLPAQADDRRLFEGLLHHHHYLSHRSTVGENLQYLVRERRGQPVACLLFGAAAWQCAARDRHIGWDAPTRAQGLHLLTNNTRFLVLPWVHVPCLASYLLGRVARRLSRDWQGKYGHPIHLLETFVERGRFAGTVYQAANWVRVGQTQGRSRQDRADGTRHEVPLKDIYLYALNPRFRQRLQANSSTLTPEASTP